MKGENFHEKDVTKDVAIAHRCFHAYRLRDGTKDFSAKSSS
jgi:hypothetical protein